MPRVSISGEEGLCIIFVAIDRLLTSCPPVSRGARYCQEEEPERQEEVVWVHHSSFWSTTFTCPSRLPCIFLLYEEGERQGPRHTSSFVSHMFTLKSKTFDGIYACVSGHSQLLASL